MEESYDITISRIRRENRDHAQHLHRDWLRKQRDANPRTEAERQAGLMSEPVCQESDVYFDYVPLRTRYNQMVDST